MRVTVLGSTGMLGHMVLKLLSDDTDLDVAGTHLGDPQDPMYFRVGQGQSRLAAIYTQSGGIDFAINCIGITADRIESECLDSVAAAIRINSLFPYELAKFAQERGFRVIHMSTDGVFSGGHEYCYEDTPADCTDIYGKTKSVGEVCCNNVLNIRCSIVGPSPVEKRGLFEWFLSQPDGSAVPGFTNHYWNGVTTLQFAELSRRIIKENLFDALRRISPKFHFTPNEPVSKYELLCLMKSALKKDITVKPAESAKGAVRRILASRYEEFACLMEPRKAIEEAIECLIESM